MYGRWLPQGPANNEGGVDLGAPAGTPVYALATGPLIGAGNFWHGGNACLYRGGPGCSPGYGVVTQRVNIPGFGINDLYYQHITLAPGIPTCYANNCGNVVIQKGQLLGYITPGVNEIEMGLNANWGGVWGVNHPAPWATDPRPALAALATGAGPDLGLGSLGATGLTVSTTPQQTSPAQCAPWDIPCILLQLVHTDWFTRGAIVFVGIVLALVGIIVLFIGNGAKVVEKHPNVAKAALL